jgi:hypothetical protein
MARAPTQSKQVTSSRAASRPGRTPPARTAFRNVRTPPAAEESSNLLATVEQILSWLGSETLRRAPRFLRELEAECREKIARAPMELN